MKRLSHSHALSTTHLQAETGPLSGQCGCGQAVLKPRHHIEIHIEVHNTLHSGLASSMQELKLEATCFICDDGGTSMTSFLTGLEHLRTVTLRSQAKAVNYGPMLRELPHVKDSQWDPL